MIDYLNVSIYLEDEEGVCFSEWHVRGQRRENDQFWTGTYSELIIEHDHNNHVDEIAEKHRRVNIANKQGLFQLSVEFKDGFYEVRVTESTETASRMKWAPSSSEFWREVRRWGDRTCASSIPVYVNGQPTALRWQICSIVWHVEIIEIRIHHSPLHSGCIWSMDWCCFFWFLRNGIDLSTDGF